MDTSTPAAARPPDGAWRWDQLDVDAYLARVGYRGTPAVGPESLTALHRAHVAAIPFENLDLQLGRGVSVALPDIEAKLVHAGRGGYCYEHGLLFSAVLDRLGFAVEPMLARTGDPAVHPRPRSHLVVRVRLGDTAWLADPGFGSGLLAPVPLAEGGVHHQGDWALRVQRGDDGGWRLQERRSGQWETLYTVAEEATYPVDIATANYLTSTSPGSPFVRQVVVVRKGDHDLRQLINREYSVTSADGATTTRVVTDEELGTLLAELGLPLSAAETAELITHLPVVAS